jgi:hypothetical protein
MGTMTKRAPATLLATLGLLTASAPASANVVATDGGMVHTYEVQPPTARRVEGRVGMLLGGSDVGDADGFSLGISAGLGYRIGDITLRGLFDHYRVGDGSDEAAGRRGRGTRLGGALRYSFANTGEIARSGAGVGVDFWGEVGVGMEHVAWRQGGVLDRPSGELAVGFEVDAQGERRANSRRRHIGYFMAFRTLLGQGPEMDGPAVCAGPCTKATRPSRTDVSMFFEVGLHWGR